MWTKKNSTGHTVSRPRPECRGISLVYCMRGCIRGMFAHCIPAKDQRCSRLICRMRQNITPTLHTPTRGTTGIQVPTHHDVVAVPRSTFIPCGLLQQELHQIDMLRVTDDFGYSVYRKVCRVVGRHLQQCTHC